MAGFDAMDFSVIATGQKMEMSLVARQVQFMKQRVGKDVENINIEAIIKKLRITKPSKYYGVCVVGLHGMGGVGKTTFCRVLCDELYKDFEGRVCHVELGIETEPIELHKEMLRRLTNVNHDSLKSMDKFKTLKLLERHLPRQRVFLALDDVWQKTLEQAMDYLWASFCKGSIVMVTACSIDILGFLNIDKSDCLEMPDLVEADAKQLFLYRGIPKDVSISEDDEENIRYCIRQCWFFKGANMEGHFHPLALKVLGAQLASLGFDPSLWVKNLSIKDKFNQFREVMHPIFHILRKGYDSLRKEDQLLFMDAILFHPSQRISSYWDSKKVLKDIRLRDKFEFGDTIRHDTFWLDIYKWLSIVHGLQEVELIQVLQGLKARSLIEDIGDSSNGAIVHDLYLEFVKFEVKRGALDGRHWVWYDNEVMDPADLKQTPSGKCWSNSKRILVKYVYNPYDMSRRWMGTMEGMKWRHFSNVVVLQLFLGKNEKLDLRSLRCLKSMELWWSDEGCRGCKSGGELIGLGELKSLAWLDMRNIHFAPCFKEIGELERLEVLRLDTNCFEECMLCKPLEPPNLEKCIHLQELVLQCACLISFPDLSKLTSLRKILFEGCQNAKAVVGLSAQMTSLEELLLISCHSLSHCPGLSNLVSLQQLDVERCFELSLSLSLSKFTKLRRMSILNNNFMELLELNDSKQLEELVCDFEVDQLPNLHPLKLLQRLNMECIEASKVLRFDSFTAMEELIFYDLREVTDIHGMHSLTRLKRLIIRKVPNLLQLPELGDLMALQHLELSECCSFKREFELLDLHNLVNLDVLEITTTPIKSLPRLESLTKLKLSGCRSLEGELDLHNLVNLDVLEIRDTPIRSLPSLECLTQLKELICSGTLLAKLSALNGFDKLEVIDLSKCRELMSVEDWGTLPALMELNVLLCTGLTRLQDFENCRSLQYLSFCYSEPTSRRHEGPSKLTSTCHVGLGPR